MSIEIKFAGTGKPDVDAQMRAYLGSTPPPNGNGVYTDQAYPLTMANITDGSPVELGTGPNTLRVSCMSHPPDQINVFALILDATVIAGPLTCTGNAWEEQRQQFSIHGTWGPPPHAVKFVSGGAQAELKDFSVTSCTFDFLPAGYTGPSLDARGGPDLVGALSVWDNIGAAFTMKIPADFPIPPQPPVGNATITGATINGTTAAPASLADLVAATPDGGILALPAGTWSGTAAVPAACTVRGAGIGRTIIDATGVELARGKAIFVPLVAHCFFSDMTLQGAAVSDLNGAGIREDGPGIGWTATNVEFTGNQDGILTFPSNITLNACSFHGNGAHDAHSHEMYFNGSPTTTVVLNSVVSVCGSGSTHALKSRAGTTRVTGGSYTGNPGAEAGDVTGSVLNFPDGGAVQISDATIIVASAGSDPNIVFISYGTESAANGAAGKVTLTNVHVIDRSGTGGVFLAGAATPGAHLVIGAGCTYEGAKAPQFQGWASVSGAFAQAAA